MLADLESDLGSLLDHPGRVALLTGVLRVLPTEAHATADGGVDSLLTAPPSSPPTDGVSERGGPVAEIAGFLDAGELYAGVATPARTALSLYSGHEDWAPGLNDLEDEHGLDAITRLVGLGLIAEGLSDADSDGAASAWLQTSSGRAALVWFAAVEVVLAYGTVDEPVESDKVLALLDDCFDRAIDAWSEYASERSLARARIIVNNWTDVLCPAVEAAASMVADIASTVREALGEGGESDVEALEHEARALAVYRSLVARHVGEVLHGDTVASGEPVPPSAVNPSTEPQAAEPSTHSDPEPEAAPEPEGTDEPAADPDANRLTAITSGLERARQAKGEAVESLQEALQHQATRAQELTALDVRLDEHRALLQSATEELAGHRSSRGHLIAATGDAASAQSTQSAMLHSLTQALSQAESVLSDAQEVRDTRAARTDEQGKALRAARTQHRRALSRQLRCAKAVRDAHRQTRDLMATSEDAPIHAIGDRIADVRQGLGLAKGRLADLRKNRRAAARHQQAIAARAGATEESVAKLREEIEGAVLAVKGAKADLKGRSSALASNESKLRKRRHRVDDLEDRQAGADEVVQELTDAIGETRDALDAVVDTVRQGRKAAAARKTERKKQIRQRLSALSQQRDEHRATLIPMTSSLELNTAALEAKETLCAEAEAALNQSRDALQTVTRTQQDAIQAKQTAIELTKAAMDMLRKNAKRLEESHQGLREAQALADGLMKERNLALGKKDRYASDVATSQREESDTAGRIQELQLAVEQTQSAIERNAGKLVRAKEKIHLARVARAEALRSEIEGKRARIAVLREQVAEAVEDREGLAVAEVRVDTQVVEAKASRAPLVQRTSALQKAREERDDAIGRRRRELDAMNSRLSAIAADVDGAHLSIRGLEAGVTARRRQVASLQGRLAVLDASIGSAQTTEDDAVERVADFQSWVERTQGAIARLGKAQKAPPPPPIPPAPPSRSAKVDKLLAKLQPKGAPVVSDPSVVPDPAAALESTAVPEPPAVPDPSAVPEVDGAATVMVDRQTLLQASEAEGSGDAATEVFSPEELIARLAEEDGDATVMMPRTQRRPKRTRDD